MQSEVLLFEEAKKLHINGKIKEAQAIYLKLLKTNSKNSNLLYLLGTTYVQLKNFKKAKESLDISIKINNVFPESYNSRGVIFAEKGDYLNAIKDYDKALSLKKNYFDANLNKAVALKNISKFSEAIKYLEICIKLKPNDYKIYNNLGNIFSSLKKYTLARNSYTKAIELNTNFAEAYSNRGELLQLYFNDFENAIEDYNIALKINENLDYVKGKRLNAKMALHDWKDYEKEIKLINDDIKMKKKNNQSFYTHLVNRRS